MGLKDIIDIEDLLTWTYRHVEIDRQAEEYCEPSLKPVDAAAQAASRWHALITYGCPAWSMRSTAELIDDPHMDAIRVHDAVLALPPVFVEWSGPDQIVMHEAAGGVMTEAALAGMGAIVESRPGGWLLRRQDGSTSAVDRLEPSVIVILNARSGGRPEAWAGWDSEQRPTDGLLDEPHVLRDRISYAVWRQALADLVVMLDGMLDQHIAQGPRAEPEPWVVRKVHQASPSRPLAPISPHASRKKSRHKALARNEKIA